MHLCVLVYLCICRINRDGAPRVGSAQQGGTGCACSSVPVGVGVGVRVRVHLCVCLSEYACLLLRSNDSL